MNDQALQLRMQIERKKNDDANKAKTISIVSGKGGVGKSNFAINFALQLIHLNKRVIIFDLDIGMGNIDILLGLQAKKTVIDMLEQKLSIEEIIEYGPKDLAYIAGGSGLTNIFTMGDEKVNLFLQEYEKISHLYDYILFDLGAGVSEHGLFFTLSADETFVITTPEPTAITDAYSIVKYVASKEVKMPFYVVMNRVKKKQIGEEMLERFSKVIKQFLQIDIYKLGVLPIDDIVRDAVMRQTPYILLDERAPISKAMKDLVISYIDEIPPETSRLKRSFIQRLRQFFVGR
ncbi:MAG TPA: MinD/ParA family protein [Bacillota bacterium]|nr:MinD/ParA family protein [Bacillota bacterium]